MRYVVLVLLSGFTVPLAAQFTVLSGPCDFGTVQVVGETPWVPGTPTRLGFDLFPNGTPVNTPNPAGGAALVSAPLGTSFQSVGVVFEVDDVAISQPSNPGGIGAMSLPNALAGTAVTGWTQPIEIRFVDPSTGNPTTVPAAGIWSVDGPTNDTSATFFDSSGGIIAVVPATTLLSFLGIEAVAGIARMVIATSAPDDFFAEDLYYGNAPFAGGLPATESTRVGTPPNPIALLPGQTSGPVTGTVWDPVIDHSTFVPGAVFDLFALGIVSANVPHPTWGTILCGGIAGTPFANLAGVPFAIPLPNVCSLLGLAFCAQGLSTDGTVLALTNALDITIGNQ